MFNQKPSKNEKPSNALCDIIWPHQTLFDVRHIHGLFQNSTTTVTSIDPGTVNYGIRICRRNNTIKTTKSLYLDRWELDQAPKKEKKGRGVEYDIHLDPRYPSLTNKLDKILDLIQQCDILLIEKQLPINYNANRIMQHTIGYFENVFKQNITNRYPVIILISPVLKGRMLGVPKGLPKPELKKWSVDEAYYIAEDEGDDWAIQQLNRCRKQDDIADTITQYKAFLLYFKINDLVIAPKERKVKIVKDEEKTSTTSS